MIQFEPYFPSSAAKNMKMLQFDIGTAYLNGDLSKEIYMQQPEGYINSSNVKLVCKLIKSLYGLRQSGRQWNIKFDQFLKKYNLIPSDADSCVYYNKTIDGHIEAIVGIFVDDGIACAIDQHCNGNPLYTISKQFFRLSRRS